jgi:hypothetical protein
MRTRLRRGRGGLSEILIAETTGDSREGRELGHARVYVRRTGAHGAGHVGWAFTVASGSWEAGAVERGGIITPPLADGFWSEELIDPSPRMLALNYHAYKELDVPFPNVAAAREQEARVDRRMFSIARHNCMNDTFDVLTAYGAVLPDPDNISDWRPNDWYRAVVGEETRL